MCNSHPNPYPQEEALSDRSGSLSQGARVGAVFAKGSVNGAHHVYLSNFEKGKRSPISPYPPVMSTIIEIRDRFGEVLKRYASSDATLGLRGAVMEGAELTGAQLAGMDMERIDLY
ncbi:MAG: hypothetical protein IGR76_08425 [Synechococcales cyanobacterium T60_A2020_003]|nr:hypothetical protein [Synechococcales cyanobacterium T60_A2020_003]